MSDKAKIKKEVKIVLRALLLSAPLGLTAVEIERDFRQAQGYGAPYRELGYNSTSDLVEDLPDVASCHWERGHAVFRGVADKTTKHIQSLVSKQNVDVRKCLKRRNALERQVVRTGGRSYSSSTVIRRPPYHYQSSTYSRSTTGGDGPAGGRRSYSYPGSGTGASGRYQSKPATIPSTSPAYLRTQLKSILTAHPNGILNTHFDSIFSRKFGFCIDYSKLGFSGLADLVKSLSSTISVEHLENEKFRVYSAENFPKGAITLPIPDARKSLPFKSPPQPSSISARAGRARRLVHGRSSETTPRSASSASTESVTSPRDASPTGNDFIDKELCEEIQKILAEHPDGIFAASLPTEYKNLTGKELPLISIGFYSVVELVSAIPEIVAIERQQKNSDWKLFDARTFVPPKATETERKKKPSSSPQAADDGRLADAKTSIREVLLAYPTGVLLQDLAASYEKFYKKSLPCQDFGVNDVNSLVLAIPDTIKVVYQGQNQVYLHAQDQMMSLNRPLYSSISKSIPQDAIGYGYSYPAARKPQLNEYFPMFISTVYNPHKISIQLKDKESNLALERLMDKLESVYSYPEGEKYLMPDAMIAIHQICCALYHEDNNWHRGLITGVPNMDLVEVLYVDYGTSLRVPKNSLRLLKSCFMKLPIQAVDAKLAGIEPLGDRWTDESRDRLLSLSFNKAMVATAVEDKTATGVFDMIPFQEKSVVALLLCDTSTEEDIHINDLLVNEGLARFRDEYKPQTELSLKMLTGIGLPVPDEDPSMAFHWPDESSEVQEIMGSDPDGDRRIPVGPEPPPGDAVNADHAVHGGGDGERRRGVEGVVAETEPPPKQDEDEQDTLEQKREELSDINEELEGGEQIFFTVKCVDLAADLSLHLISFGGHGQYVTSAEIARLIWSRTEVDENALFEMIEKKAAQLGQVIVEELDNVDLAENLEKQGVPLSSTRPSRLQLFLITSLPALVLVSGRANPELYRRLQAIADDMPPLEDDELSVSSETSGSVGADIDPSELEVMHSVLRNKRERILKDLMSNSGVGNVDEVMHIERLMKEIQEKLERAKARGTEGTTGKKRTPSGSVDEISTQLLHTSLGSTVSHTPTTPDDVFSPPDSSYHDVMMASELPASDHRSQTGEYDGHRRHASDRLGMPHKQTATISPLKRQSTGGIHPGQRGIGRGAMSRGATLSHERMPAGIGRGQQMQHMYAPSLENMSLNPDSPVFVPSPRRDDTGKNSFPPNFFASPFMNSPPQMPPFTRGGQNVVPMFSDVPEMFKRSIPLLPPNMPPMPKRMASMTMPAAPPRLLPDVLGPGHSAFIPPLGLSVPPLGLSVPPPPPFAAQRHAMPNPGLPLPAGFDLIQPGQGFDPNMPPPALYGMGRGHQQWSIND